jgi:antitoxin (DNA-binding transcriptional repressor) of toxin-antitoxin stability system
MKTLSPTEARANLTSWLKRAAAGEEIGILCGNKVIALQPVEVQSTDYALREYTLASVQLDQWTKNMDHEIEQERAKGKVRRYSGNLEADLRD